MACVDVAMASVKPATTNSLIIVTLLLKSRNAKLVPFGGNNQSACRTRKEFDLEAAVRTASSSLRVSLLADVHDPAATRDRCAGRAIMPLLCATDQATITSLQ
jgi:hypothetical protein